MLFGCVDEKIKHKEEVNMKTYKSMLSVVCCWCLCLSLCSLSFAENTMTEKPVVDKPALTYPTDDVKIALEKERLSKGKEKEKVVETHLTGVCEEQTEKKLKISNAYRDLTPEEISIKEAYYLENPIENTQDESIQDLKNRKESLNSRGLTAEEYIQAVAADKASIAKENAVSYEKYLEGFNAKEQAVALEYILQSPSNNEGNVVNNPKVPHLKGFSPGGLKSIRADQDKVDYYNNLHQENEAAHGGSSIEDWTDSQYTSELTSQKAHAFGTNVYVNDSRC